MNDLEDMVEVQPNDFTIRIRPYLTEQGTWEGDVDIAVMSHPGNDIQDEDYYHIMHFCKMVASAVPIMEQNEAIRDAVHDYVINVVDNEYDMRVEEEYDNKDKPTVTTEGNIHTINFTSNTKGSA